MCSDNPPNAMAGDATPATPRTLADELTVAYQSALYQAYFATGPEQTKSVFTLASAGVGLALTLLFSDKAKPIASWVPIWLLLAVVAFALAAALCVWVFQINGALVLRLAQDEGAEREDALVGRAHLASLWAFTMGLLFLVFAATAQLWL